jgi:hypothetical protein
MCCWLALKLQHPALKQKLVNHSLQQAVWRGIMMHSTISGLDMCVELCVIGSKGLKGSNDLIFDVMQVGAYSLLFVGFFAKHDYLAEMYGFDPVHGR